MAMALERGSLVFLRARASAPPSTIEEGARGTEHREAAAVMVDGCEKVAVVEQEGQKEQKEEQEEMQEQESEEENEQEQESEEKEEQDGEDDIVTLDEVECEEQEEEEGEEMASVDTHTNTHAHPSQLHT
jgi:hypothetical protein